MDKKQAGFTLIEMMIVLLVISVLLIITIPNVTKNNSTINNKGCEAFVRMVEGQVQSYRLDNEDKIPKLEDLAKEGYIGKEDGDGNVTGTSCPNGDSITIDAADGTVTTTKSTET
jgi:competence protein ComGC